MASPTEASAPICPVRSDVCDAATILLTLLNEGDVDALIATSDPVATTCPAGGLGGPSALLCQGAQSGEQRLGYLDSQAGEALIVSEAEFRGSLERWLASVERATGADALGSGSLRVGSLRCGREPGAPSGTCLPREIRVYFTFINAADIEPSAGTGLPGERSTFFVSLHEAGDGALLVDGIGTSVPPNAALDAFVHEGVDLEGRRVLFEYYPWLPDRADGEFIRFRFVDLGIEVVYPRTSADADARCQPTPAGPGSVILGANIAIEVDDAEHASLEAAVERWLEVHALDPGDRSSTLVDGADAVRVEYRLSASSRFGIATITRHGGRTYAIVYEARRPDDCGASSPTELYDAVVDGLKFLS